MEKKPAVIRAHNPLANLQHRYSSLEAENAQLKQRLAEFDPLIMLKKLHQLEVDNLTEQIEELKTMCDKQQAYIAQLELKTVHEICEWK